MSKIVSIHSYRGGTGKSNSTANIATAVALKGYRVGIVDADIQSPGIHILFGLNPEKIDRTLNDFLWGQCAIADAAYNVTSVLKDQAAANSKIYLIPSSIKVNDISRILRERFDIETLLDGFQSLIKDLNLDYLFIDTHPGLNQETLISLTTSDIVLLILRPDQQDFQGTAVMVDVARKLRVPNLLLMINKALKEYDFEDLRQQVEQTYKAPVVGILPESEDMLRLASSSIFYLKYPQHPVSQAVEKIAQKIIF
ncbi:CDP-3,6-dideoxy-D-glycero-L-glycero-4-hexulose-4-reductase [[Phormidium ambiguum] IAM M-71]|uniref:CDP-3, 6-dideoxy-D-glycero-L-glycero-4-hexulose-4-reductase n=1 Tax=[Phormidium ambiguum] IAM M-71 TaxID=454136 RepID=A0A1U7I8A2_9CYAN|nr:MinD/ParA family protein [Phormidium ambiguum]OKH32667.1 CDP-3,6-dideoxy-D-glycero-L-glycero-4-hexulose-4-reductase [Phormidium ambiguum IAM M-71]